MKYLFPIVLFKLFFMLFLIKYGEIALGPDEAQYWTWSQALDWGYYSKPPGIAWMIALGDFLCGPTELGVRLYALLIGALLPFAVFHLALSAKLPQRSALWAGALMALTPLGFLSSLFATTDGGFVLFWVLALSVWVKAAENKEPINALVFSLFVACGALFKWPIYLLWAVVVVCYPRQWKVFLWALVGLLPSLYWNITHKWATFRHVGATLSGGSQEVAKGNPLDFIGAQAALLSPLLFLLFVYALFIWFKKREEMGRGLSLCCALACLPLAAYWIASFFQKIQGNWCVFAYPSAFVLLAAVFQKRSKWLYAGCTLSVLLTVALLGLPSMLAQGYLGGLSRSNPFKECVGWRQLVAVIEKAEHKEEWFFFAHTYQMASELSFYNEEKKRAYFFNLEGRRLNQFSYWPQMAEKERGRNGLFVALDKEKKWEELLAGYFQRVEMDGESSLFKAGDKVVKEVRIYRCYGYNGKMPSLVEAY